MLSFHHITDLNVKLAGEIKLLYERSFPLRERRTWEELVRLLEEPAMSLKAIANEQQFIGLVVYWQFEEWLYLEHFAIVPELRGQQFGRKVIECLLQESFGKLILETEPSESQDSVRRIAFYEKCGLNIIPYPYQQPPYRREELSFPMLLISSTQLNQNQYELIAALIKERVYDRFSD
ncbi:MAG: GNAT family N-acetyltransferase [Bacteroidota bacterium]|nr:GNAT family N-acetyltransferase [Bacteroidota bacterium]